MIWGSGGRYPGPGMICMKDDQQPRQFVDTNIFLYAYDYSDPVKNRRAKSLVKNLWDSGLGSISIQVLQELYVNLTRKVPHPLPSGYAGSIISDLGRWRLHLPNLESLLGAVHIEQRYQISFWDAMIISSAVTMKCSILWSEDLNHGQEYRGVKVLNPFLSHGDGGFESCGQFDPF